MLQSRVGGLNEGNAWSSRRADGTATPGGWVRMRHVGCHVPGSSTPPLSHGEAIQRSSRADEIAPDTWSVQGPFGV